MYTQTPAQKVAGSSGMAGIQYGHSRKMGHAAVVTTYGSTEPQCPYACRLPRPVGKNTCCDLFASSFVLEQHKHMAPQHIMTAQQVAAAAQGR